MSGDRFVLLGLAPARTPWFDAVSQWTTSAAVAAEFIKCVSAEEVRSRLSSGRPHSALIVDASSPALDRDLVDAAQARDTPVLVVLTGREPPMWAHDLGCAAELPPRFGRDDLVEVLGTHCVPVGPATGLPPLIADSPAPLWQAPLFCVCGPGGTGASVVAVALAQGLAADPRHGSRVLLADLALRADQAMLHDSPELGPGIQELIEAHRLARPTPDEIARMTFDAPRRGYRLLLGLRQPEGWSALRPRATDAALLGLRRSFQAVVADVTGDVEGEAETGSVEVQERNHLARAAALSATVAVAVGAPGMKGIHSLSRLIRDLIKAGVNPDRIVAVINRSPRHPRARADSGRALASLLNASGHRLALAGPVHLPERKIEDTLRDAEPLPPALVEPVTRAARMVADRVADAAPPSIGPERIAPGSLSSWSDAEYGSGGP